MTAIVVTHRFDRGLSWAPAGPSMLQCRSHALVAEDGGVWLVDPFDGAGLDQELAQLGNVAGIIVLLDRHLRDAVIVARRHGVPLLVPPGRWRTTHPRPLDAVDANRGVSGCPFQFRRIVQRDGAWLEQALWWSEQRILVIAEAVGTSDAYRSRPDVELGVHPLLRVRGAPGGLVGLMVDPRLLLLGHGPPVEHAIGPALADAIRTARSELPRLLLRTPKLVTGWLRASRRGTRMTC